MCHAREALTAGARPSTTAPDARTGTRVCNTTSAQTVATAAVSKVPNGTVTASQDTWGTSASILTHVRQVHVPRVLRVRMFGLRPIDVSVKRTGTTVQSATTSMLAQVRRV